ncbi:TetR/AcrR family transcriptional regulator [Bacteroidales bacterium AH-315-N07]|nr:TetR/AcrR family transcriptional regulator [Bacteroidales bacterium AH-315-N07]
MNKNSILTESLFLFVKYGIKSITMDDVARELQISKKTLYQIVEDKKDLVEKTTLLFTQRDRHALLSIVNEHKHVIDQLIYLCKQSSNLVRNQNPVFLFDLKRYYLNGWKIYREYKVTGYYNLIYHTIQKGIEEGFYRDNINLDIVSKFYISQIEMITNQDLFPSTKYIFENVMNEFLTCFIYGISTTKGKKYVNRLISADVLR